MSWLLLSEAEMQKDFKTENADLSDDCRRLSWFHTSACQSPICDVSGRESETDGVQICKLSGKRQRRAETVL